MDIIECTGWNFCNLCRSEKYIIDYFPKGHWAYTCFKTKSNRIFQQHESSKDHMKHFEKYYCEPCEKQCYSQSEFNNHCETIRHKQKNNITMNCEVCKYSTTDKYKFERHTFSLKHQNAINGVQKKELVCEPCNFRTKYESKLKEHQETQRHQNAVSGLQIEKGPCVCELCNFKARSRSAMIIHEDSKKHKNAVAYKEKLTKDTSEQVPDCHRC